MRPTPPPALPTDGAPVPPSGGIGRLRDALRPPRDLLRRMRLLFSLFGAVSAISLVPLVLVSETGQPHWMRYAALAGMLLVAASWVVAYRRGRSSVLDWVLEPLAFTAVGLCLPVPMNILLLVFGGLLYRSLFGSTLSAVIRSVVYLAVVLLVVSLNPLFPYPVLSVESLGRTPSMFAIVALVRMLYRTVVAAERIHARQAVLSRAGTELLRLARREQVVGAGFRTLVDLARLSGGRLDAVLLIEVDEGFTVAGSLVDGTAARTGQRLPADAVRAVEALRTGGWSPAPQDLADAVAPGKWENGWVAVPLVARGHRYGVILLRGADDDVSGSQDSVLLLATQLAFALASSRAAWHDTMTDLPNRALLRESVEHAADSGDPTAVIYLDLDGFKAINDTYGHATGDAVLMEVASRLRAVIRPGDLAARLGGDEFAVLLHDVTGEDEARGVAQRLLSALDEPFLVAGRSLSVGGSIGVALGGSDLADIVRLADVAMYRAKADGKGRVAVYSAAEDDQMLRHDVLRQHLPLAVARQELVVHYQPVVDVSSGRTVAVEALVRWQHPRFGMVPPMEFIPLAEADGHITDIGEWILRTACAEVAEWRRSGLDIDLNVNLSPLQLTDNDIVRRVADALADTGLPPHALTLEVTESALVSDDDAVARLGALSEAGIRIAVDDFGTGYASMAYLQRLPVDVVKIDRSFVATIGVIPQQPQLARASVLMAQSLGLTAVAEGVESAEQLTALRDYGCDLAQGYALLKPQTGAQVREWLEAGSAAKAEVAGTLR